MHQREILRNDGPIFGYLTQRKPWGRVCASNLGTGASDREGGSRIPWEEGTRRLGIDGYLGAWYTCDMWNLSLPWWEFVLRALIVYFFLIVLLRVTGKRQIGQMSPFDLVLLLVLSNAVQNSMNGGDNSVLAGMILAATLVGCNAGISFLTNHSKTMEKLVEGEPEILIFNGKLMKKTMEKEGISMAELGGAMRVAGCDNAKEVHLATMEVNGQISIVRAETPEGETPRVYRVPRGLRRKGRRSGYGS